MAKVTALNSEFLKNFITDHIEVFADSLDKIRKDDPTAGQAISTIAKETPDNTTLTAPRPLVIGHLAGDKSQAGGADLNKVIQGEAVELERILDEHEVLFKDLQAAMEETIEKLKDAQGKNLESITPEEFGEIFEDVNSDLAGPGEEEEEE